jgi:hypothetical protein
MVRTKLNTEISKFLGIPYFTNKGKYKNNGENAYVGKGSAKEIALATIDLANKMNVKLTDLSSQQIYNFQKKHHIGIDCSGLVTHLLNFYFDQNLNPRKTSADMLTSLPLSKKIILKDVATGDLIRQEKGHHVLFVLDKTSDSLIYIDSSVKGRGVRFGKIPISPPPALYRLAVRSK